MIKRTIEISQAPAHLSVRDEQMVISSISRGKACGATVFGEEIGRVPLEDLGILVIDQRETTVSASCLASLSGHGVALCICDASHLPTGLLLPLSDRHETIWRINDQIAMSRPTKKRLWRQIVRAKIHGQMRNLPQDSPATNKLRALRDAVRSGDPANVEAQAARIYWDQWLGEESGFRRIPGAGNEGPAPNNFLDYGYAVIRAAVARAIISAGLLPALGIHHHSRSNCYCLADDLVEPLRPLVDREARALFLSGQSELTPDTKRALLAVLTTSVRVRASADPAVRLKSPLMVSLQRYLASFVECMAGTGNGQKLAIPIW